MNRDYRAACLPAGMRGAGQAHAAASAVAKSGPPIFACFRSSVPGAVLYVTAFLWGISAAHADPLATVNAIRAAGCAGDSSAGSAVTLSDALTGIARELSQRPGLNDAIERAGYPAESATALYVTGPADDASIRVILEARSCKAVNNPQFSEMGVYRRGAEMWLVLATPLKLPALEDSAAIAARVLALVNTAREQARQCGSTSYEPAPPVRLSPVLSDVALQHAQDMAQHRLMDHRGSDGSQPAERLTRAGYRWRTVAENVAAGQSSADEVVAAWLDSPGHCINIMEPRFTEMGAAFALVPGNPPIYWTQMFAMPR